MNNFLIGKAHWLIDLNPIPDGFSTACLCFKRWWWCWWWWFDICPWTQHQGRMVIINSINILSSRCSLHIPRKAMIYSSSIILCQVQFIRLLSRIDIHSLLQRGKEQTSKGPVPTTWPDCFIPFRYPRRKLFLTRKDPYHTRRNSDQTFKDCLKTFWNILYKAIFLIDHALAR